MIKESFQNEEIYKQRKIPFLRPLNRSGHEQLLTTESDVTVFNGHANGFLIHWQFAWWQKAGLAILPLLRRHWNFD